jgi:hypothetical protein
MRLLSNSAFLLTAATWASVEEENRGGPGDLIRGGSYFVSHGTGTVSQYAVYP